MKQHKLHEVDEPRLFENVFPHTEVPRIVFDGKVYEEIDGKVVSFDPSLVRKRDIWISDTTFRDGQQSRPPYTPQQIVTIFKFLSRLSGHHGVVRQTEFFIYTERDREAVRKCQELELKYPQITSWIRADLGDFAFVKEMGLTETGILTSCSDYHIFHKLKLDRRKAMERYLQVVEAGLEAGIRMRCHMEDITRADTEGFVLPFLQKVMELAEKAPPELRTKVRLCDTMGFGITYPGAALPRSIPKLVWKVIHEAGVPSERLEWHGHNDFHKVHINAATAWLYGCDICNTTLFGFGERTGNPPLEAALIEYMALKGAHAGIDTKAITEAADYFRDELGMEIPGSYPFAGANFNVTRAGIHADGLRRDERIYNIFDTEKILGRPPKVAITDKSGADGVAVWVNAFLGFKGKERLRKIDLHQIARWVTDQYSVYRRTTSISDEEMEEQVRTHLPDEYEKYLERKQK